MSHQYSVLLFGSAKAAAGGAPSVAVHAPTPTLSPSALRDLLAAAVAGADWRGVLESAALAVDQAYVAWDDAAVALSPRSEIAVIPAVSDECIEMPSFDEFLAEFPREYRHADPLYRVLARVVARLLVDPARARGSGQPLALLEMGSGLGEHALYYSHLNAAGALDWAAAAPGAPGGGDEVGAPVPAKFTAPSDRQPAAAPPAVVWQPTEIGAAMAELRGVWAKWQQHAPPHVRQCVLEPRVVEAGSAAHWDAVGAQQWDVMLTVNTLHIMSGADALASLSLGAARCLRRGGVFLAYGPFRFRGAHTADSNVRFDAFLAAREPAGTMGVRDATALEQHAAAHGLRLADTIAMPENNFVLAFEKI